MTLRSPVESAGTIFLVVEDFQDALVLARSEHLGRGVERVLARVVELAEEEPVVHDQRALEPEHLVSRAYLLRVEQLQVELGALLAFHLLGEFALIWTD